MARRLHQRALPAQLDELVRILAFINAPRIVLQLTILLWATCHGPKDFVELFAGKGAITKAFVNAGYRAAAFDLEYHDDHNAVSTIGFMVMFSLVLDMVAGGALHAAPVCSSWLWMSRYVTRRCPSSPLGNPDIDIVRIGNIMVARLVLCLYVCVARGILFIFEQPQGSTAQAHPKMQEFFKHNIVYRTTAAHIDFDGDSVKPFWLYCMDQRIQHINKYKTSDERRDARALGRSYTNTNGKRCYDGDHAGLKKSQAYTPEFGRAVLSLVESIQHETRRNAQELRLRALAAVPSVPDTVWGDIDTSWNKDADLEEVLKLFDV